MIHNSKLEKSILWVAALLMIASFAFAEEPDDEQKARTGRRAAQEKSDVTASLGTGIGYDSNVYRAPDAPYTDYFPTVPVAVTPVKHSGFFVPVSVNIDYMKQMGMGARILAELSSDNSLYVKSENNNANKYTHKLAVGPEFVIGTKGKKENTVKIIPFILSHTETYYDRDTGSDKATTAGEDIADNYSYDSIGVEAAVRVKTLPVPVGITVEWEKRDYTNTGFVSEYDHTYYLVGADVSIPLMTRTELDLQYDYYVRDYNDRHSRDLNGSLFASAPLLKYVYNEAGASLRVKAAKHVTIYVDYAHTEREDANYVGYNDFSEDEFGLRAIFHYDTLKIRAKYAWWDRSYPTAYAFDNPAQARLDYDGKKMLIKVEKSLSKRTDVWLEYDFRNIDSTDLRYDYDKYQVMAGVKFTM